MSYEVAGIKIICIKSLHYFFGLLTRSEICGMISEHELRYWNHGEAEKYKIQKLILRQVTLWQETRPANNHNKDQASLGKSHLPWEMEGWKGKVNILIKFNFFYWFLFARCILQNTYNAFDIEVFGKSCWISQGESSAPSIISYILFICDLFLSP